MSIIIGNELNQRLEIIVNTNGKIAFTINSEGEYTTFFQFDTIRDVKLMTALVNDAVKFFKDGEETYGEELEPLETK